MNEHMREMRDGMTLGNLSALPEWARELLENRTPYIASDPELWVSYISEMRCQVYAREFFYGIDKERAQVI
jgi:hypothetical protein